MKKTQTIPLKEWKQILKENPDSTKTIMWDAKCPRCADCSGKEYYYHCKKCGTTYHAVKYVDGRPLKEISDVRFIYVS